MAIHHAFGLASGEVLLSELAIIGGHKFGPMMTMVTVVTVVTVVTGMTHHHHIIHFRQKMTVTMLLVVMVTHHHPTITTLLLVFIVVVVAIEIVIIAHSTALRWWSTHGKVTRAYEISSLMGRLIVDHQVLIWSHDLHLCGRCAKDLRRCHNLLQISHIWTDFICGSLLDQLLSIFCHFELFLNIFSGNTGHGDKVGDLGR